MFPLWTRKEGFGVISILKGGPSDWQVSIENDQIPIGTVAYYAGGPNLRVVEWGGDDAIEKPTAV